MGLHTLPDLSYDYGALEPYVHGQIDDLAECAGVDRAVVLAEVYRLCLTS